MVNSISETTFETPRLRLEPLVEAHAAELFERYSDERMFRFIPQDPPASLQGERRLLQRGAKRRVDVLEEEITTITDANREWKGWAVPSIPGFCKNNGGGASGPANVVQRTG